MTSWPAVYIYQKQSTEHSAILMKISMDWLQKRDIMGTFTSYWWASHPSRRAWQTTCQYGQSCGSWGNAPTGYGQLWTGVCGTHRTSHSPTRRPPHLSQEERKDSQIPAECSINITTVNKNKDWWCCHLLWVQTRLDRNFWPSANVYDGTQHIMQPCK